MFSKVLIYRILIVYKSLIFLFFLIEGMHNTYGGCHVCDLTCLQVSRTFLRTHS
jgi:hypothetical protein